jgi:hypothetical protein
MHEEKKTHNQKRARFSDLSAREKLRTAELFGLITNRTFPVVMFRRCLRTKSEKSATFSEARMPMISADEI